MKVMMKEVPTNQPDYSAKCDSACRGPDRRVTLLPYRPPARARLAPDPLRVNAARPLRQNAAAAP
jgi:hypothetical protein